MATAPAAAPASSKAGQPRLQEDEILRRIAHLDALIANIHARGAARMRTGPATPVAGASRGSRGSSRGASAGQDLKSSPLAKKSPATAGSDARALLSPSTRALLGMD